MGFIRPSPARHRIPSHIYQLRAKHTGDDHLAKTQALQQCPSQVVHPLPLQLVETCGGGARRRRGLELHCWCSLLLVPGRYSSASRSCAREVAGERKGGRTAGVGRSRRTPAPLQPAQDGAPPPVRPCSIVGVPESW
jgi:hypothetical protein